MRPLRMRPSSDIGCWGDRHDTLGQIPWRRGCPQDPNHAVRETPPKRAATEDPPPHLAIKVADIGKADDACARSPDEEAWEAAAKEKEASQSIPQGSWPGSDAVCRRDRVRTRALRNEPFAQQPGHPGAGAGRRLPSSTRPSSACRRRGRFCHRSGDDARGRHTRGGRPRGPAMQADTTIPNSWHRSSCMGSLPAHDVNHTSSLSGARREVSNFCGHYMVSRPKCNARRPVTQSWSRNSAEGSVLNNASCFGPKLGAAMSASFAASRCSHRGYGRSFALPAPVWARKRHGRTP